MAHWRVITLLCIAFIFVEARRSHMKRETKSHLCDPVFNNTNKIQCYCTKDSRQEIIKSAECFATTNGIPIEDLNWDAFSELKNISKLTFTSTNANLKYIPQNALKHTKNLLKLEVKYENIEVIQPFAFANLSVIREIILSDNQIKVLKVNAFAHHINLEKIGLDLNAVVEINRDVFVDLPALEMLHLTSNKITTIHDRSFVHLSNLRELEIDRNNLFSLNSETFSGLSKLEKLDLSGNSLEVIGDNTFLPLKNLRSLNLEGNKIQMLDTKAFHGLSKLETLSLAHNALANIDNEKVFDGLKSLILLSLKGNQLRTLKPEVMAPVLKNFYNNASSLDVEDNNFPCDCQLDWFILLINKTRSPHLKLATENLKCTPEQDIKDKWNKAADAEKNVLENDGNSANMDYEYYDDTQLNGKLFYIDMRYLLNCSNVYNGEVINVSNILNPQTTVKPDLTEAPKIVKSSPTTEAPLIANTDKFKPKMSEVTTKLPSKLIDNETKPNIYTTSRLATVSAKPYDNKLYDAHNMASDEAKPDKIKAYRSIQDEIKVAPTSKAGNNTYYISMLVIVTYLTLFINKY